MRAHHPPVLNETSLEGKLYFNYYLHFINERHKVSAIIKFIKINKKKTFELSVIISAEFYKNLELLKSCLFFIYIIIIFSFIQISAKFYQVFQCNTNYFSWV